MSNSHAHNQQLSAQQSAAVSGDLPDTGSTPEAGGVDDLVKTKLWQNPCPFSFRINYLALHYNIPVYGWIQKTYKLQRPEFVVLYSIGLQDGISARDVCSSSGFPRNTISRAVQRLLDNHLIERRDSAEDQRLFTLHLTQAGREIFNQTVEPLKAREELMLSALTPAENMMLHELLAKVVVQSVNWPDELTTEE